MIHESAFQTRARTVDHLGREQIADCPTAISELWKNAYDAYARTVELNIYDGTEPIAAVVDDGHGMSAEEFERRWLVVGTESKATVDHTPPEDRHGLRLRPRQGQKGIGRLSCANLGPLLLLVSKRSQSPFIASLIDWRLFENPYINLSDISIPRSEAISFESIFEQLPDLASSLSENITGGTDRNRKERIRSAWTASDELHGGELISSEPHVPEALSQQILSDISQSPFLPRHFREWPVAAGDCDHGTALVVSGINYDLRAQLNEHGSDLTASGARDRFFETLSSFIDPFVDPTDPLAARKDPQFFYVARVWHGTSHRVIIGSEKQFDKRQVDGMEHRLEGTIDVRGLFAGRVKAFGEWLPSECVIDPPDDLPIPTRRDAALGPLQVYIASMEFRSQNTTHSRPEFQFFQDLAARYAGFMIFRDGLRVLPYGRTDNDFFDIETRRSKNVGREFWNHRQMFGRIAITSEHNPNLKDKAGREGLLDNRAAKALKGLISNILKQSARRYFGSASDIRRELLPEIAAENNRKRAVEARRRLRQRHRKEFRTKLRRLSEELPGFANYVASIAECLVIDTEAQLFDSQAVLEDIRDRAADFRLGGAPTNLGSIEEKYREYRRMLRDVESNVSRIQEALERETERIRPTEPDVLLRQQFDSQKAQMHRRILRWLRTIDRLHSEEHRRIREIVRQREGLFSEEAAALVYRCESRQLSYSDASKAKNVLKQRIDEENREVFESYIGALESLRESIDLEHLARFGMEEVGELRVELERLNSLAQLGIAVEIVGHELESYDDIIGAGLRRLSNELRASEPVKDIEFGYEGLTDQLRFLSPLRLAGPKTQVWITGSEIFEYLRNFFRLPLAKNGIEWSASDAFRRFRVFEQRSRLYPVFVNLLNNSIYWVSVDGREDRKVLLDTVESEVVVADNGPGIAGEDVDSLFTCFLRGRSEAAAV